MYALASKCIVNSGLCHNSMFLILGGFARHPHVLTPSRGQKSLGVCVVTLDILKGFPAGPRIPLSHPISLLVSKVWETEFTRYALLFFAHWLLDALE